MYGFSIRLNGNFDGIVERVTAALKEEDFGVLTDIDVKVKQRLGIDRLPYPSLGACNPPLAHCAIEAEPDIGLLLPCNVVVGQEGDWQHTAAFMDPAAVLGLVQRPELEELGKDVRRRLDRIPGSIDRGLSLAE